jgi:hypothetical protein
MGERGPEPPDRESLLRKMILLLWAVIVLMACGAKTPKIDKVYEDGVEVMLNHLEPYHLSGRPVTCALSEDVRLDLEKPENADLGLKEPDIIEADSRGNIFIVEKFPASEYFIYKFDSRGRFLKKFGRKGQGPGEVQGIWDLLLDKNDRILISDPNSNKVVEFDTEGSLVTETKIGAGMREVLPLPNGNYLARRSPKDDSEPYGWYLSVFDPDFEELKRVGFFDMSELVPGKRTPGITIPFYWRVAGDRIYFGNAWKEYDIRVYDLNGNLLRKIRKDFRPVAYPEEFRAQTEKIAAAQPNLNLFVLKEMPPFNSFFVDEAGRLFVMTYEKGENGAAFIHDVFDPGGIFIARVALGAYGILGRSLNRQRASSANGRFYRLHFKENGYPELIVYKMTWK